MTSTAPAAPSPRYAGLDGLRAIAVALVVAYHLFPPALLPGGFVGVDVFFVLSGFLITSLLLREHDATGRIRLGEFWKRRARRLLPALGLVVMVCSTLAWLIDGDVLVRVGEQVIGALTFSYNWVSLAGGDGYFAATSPELFRNFWSLAVEEQFYVVWPLILPLFLLLPRVAARALAAAALAAASAAWMLAVVSAGSDPTRAYFGTDTHSFGILLGVALAFVIGPVLTRRRANDAAVTPLPTVVLPPGWTLALPTAAPARRRSTGRVTGAVGTAALLGIGALAWLPPSDSAATFPGALLAVSLLTTAAIAAAVWPGSTFGPAIDVRPMTWIGDRSYGIYLWHWPLLVLTMAAFPADGVPLWTGVGVLALTLVCAEVSYRFVETPVRRYGFRASMRRLAAQFRRGPRRRLRALGYVLVGALMLGGTSAAIAAAPTESSGQTAVEAGRAALERAHEHRTAATDGAGATTGEGATPVPTERPADVPPAGSSGGASAGGGSGPSPTPSPTPVAGSDVTAVGDSVMLASAPALLDAMPGIAIDAEVSRSMWAGPGILEALEARGSLRTYVVVALGTNGAVDRSSLERMAEIVGPDRHLILVNAHAPRDWIRGVNHDLAAFADRRRAVVLADWEAAISRRTGLLAGDEIHPGAAGGRVFARTVDDAIQAIEAERAQVEYRRELRQYLALHDRRLPQPQ